MSREPYKLLDLFSGIGGFSLGLERSGGFRTVAFCEIEPYCRRVLAKHWPGVPCYDDIRTLTAERLAADGIGVDAICGGFPCQDISFAGAGAGLAGERSGLWFEYARLVGELRPKYVIVENVGALLSRGLDAVLGTLAALGYDGEWHCIPASALGAHHQRDRLWLVANAGVGRRGGSLGGEVEQPRRTETVGASETVADAAGERRGEAWGLRYNEPAQWFAGSGSDVADADRSGLPPPWTIKVRPDGIESGRLSATSCWWGVEPDVGRVVARFSARLDGGRLNAEPAQGGTGEILRALRDGVRAPRLQWTARGFGGLQAAEILLPVVCEYEGPPRTLGHASLAGAEASHPVMRGVWFDGQAACPSCRRAAVEQRGREHPDLVRVLSQLLACDCGAAWLDPAGTPSETSRVDRLRALGNAVVPQIPELIGRAILSAEDAA